MSLLRPGPGGARPVHGAERHYAEDPHFRDLLLFYSCSSTITSTETRGKDPEAARSALSAAVSLLLRLVGRDLSGQVKPEIEQGTPNGWTRSAGQTHEVGKWR